jgi:hypothetical protein
MATSSKKPVVTEITDDGVGINLIIPKDLHRKLKIRAAAEDLYLRDLIVTVLERGA